MIVYIESIKTKTRNETSFTTYIETSTPIRTLISNVNRLVVSRFDEYFASFSWSRELYFNNEIGIGSRWINRCVCEIIDVRLCYASICL